MSERSCPMSASAGPAAGCPMANNKGRFGPRGCNFMSFSQPGDLRSVFDVSGDQFEIPARLEVLLMYTDTERH